MIDHSDHGRGDENGPNDPDCPCRATANEKDCADSGCGFCRAAISMRRSTGASPAPLHPIDRFIDSAAGYHAFLSNFCPITVEYEGVLYRSVEHAYQAAKTVIPDERRWVAQARSAGQAKVAGRRVAIRANWDSMRVEVMEYLLRQKFSFNVDGVNGDHTLLARLLAETFPRVLIEGNHWGDRFWGCTADRDGKYTVGENNLGILLMKVRAANGVTK